MRLNIILLSFFLVPGIAMAQHHHPQPPAKPAILLPGMGNLQHPIATKSAQAQRFFDQGLTLVYAFNHGDAVLSFKRAAELDPQSPMPWWGIALAVGPNYNDDVNPEREKEAYDAIQKARTLAANAPHTERDYVEALARRYSNDPKADYKALAVDYKNAMRELFARYPDDPDAGTLFAESMMDLHPWQLWTADGKPTEDTEEIVATLRFVLRHFPNHVGANHLYVHAVEASPHPEQALINAERLKTLVPSAGHLVHMPAHIYERTGFYMESVKANRAGVEADHAYLKSNPGEHAFYGMMYYSHNFHFLAVAASMAGRYAEAKSASDQLAAYAGPRVKGMPMFEWFLPMQEYILVRFNRWDEILKMPAPDPSLTLTTAIRHYARAVAFAGKRDIPKARAERKELSGAIEKQPADAMFGFSKARTVLGLALDIADARIGMAQGDLEESLDLWRHAVATQDAMPYDEPPDWYYPVRESLGAALAQNGDYAEAEKVFREDLVQNPRNPRSLFGLLEVLKAEKRLTDAAWVQTEFDEAWKNADTKLSLKEM
jgi:tetratricopeptide (TPR) repeat protein